MVGTLEVCYQSTDDLIPYANNSRTHSKKQIQEIAGSISEFGFNNPILVDEKNSIIAGHGRLYAAQLLKLDEVPTIMLEGLSEAQKKAYVIADNKIALNADWDMEILKIEMEDIGDDIDLNVLGFDKGELLDILGDDTLDDNNYTQKIDVPNYEPSGEKPNVEELYNDERTYELVENIKNSNLPQKEKDFLMLAAGRHTVLNFEQIADYYAHSDEECQKLMEDSALVIIDFKKAIEQGYVRMSDELCDQYLEEYPDEE